MGDWERLLKEHAEFEEENRRLRNEKLELQNEVENLKSENDTLWRENYKLKYGVDYDNIEKSLEDRTVNV